MATDGAVAAFGRDVRRLRPNILIGGVDGLAECDWPGAELHIGRLIVRLDSLRARCPMTTVDPDTLERDPEVLCDIGRRFRGRLALNSDVARPGTIAIGDPVTCDIVILNDTIERGPVDVREYLTVDGKNPYREWLGTLDVTARARIQARVLRFSTKNLGDHKSVGGGVWEARVMFGSGYRISARRDSSSCSCCSVATSRRRRPMWPRHGRRGRLIRRTNAVARRSEDWNVGLAEELRDPAFAREFLLAAIDEGVDIQVALGKVIRAMGVKEFAAKVRMASPNVLRAINPRHNPTQATLDRLLKPFGLRLSLAPIKGKSRQTAA